MTMTISILFYITAIITLTSCQRIPAHAVTSIMQNILSPKNTAQLSQLIKTAANGHISELQIPNKRNIMLEAGLPRNLAGKEVIEIMMMPRAAVAQRTGPTKIIIRRPNEVVNDIDSPTQIIIKKPELAIPKTVLVQKPDVVSNRRILVQKANEIPRLRNLDRSTLPKAVVVKTNEVPQVLRSAAEINTSRVLLHEPKAIKRASETVIASNPFLPVASPGSSPASKVSNAVPESRGQFLRKIPIPPPTI